jgi:hypothetical protein
MAKCVPLDGTHPGYNVDQVGGLLLKIKCISSDSCILAHFSMTDGGVT